MTVISQYHNSSREKDEDTHRRGHGERERKREYVRERMNIKNLNIWFYKGFGFHMCLDHIYVCLSNSFQIHPPFYTQSTFFSFFFLIPFKSNLCYSNILECVPFHCSQGLYSQRKLSVPLLAANVAVCSTARVGLCAQTPSPCQNLVYLGLVQVFNM